MQSPAINQAMDILKLLRQVTEGQDEAPVKLAKIIKIIAEKMNADALPVMSRSMTAIWNCSRLTGSMPM